MYINRTVFRFLITGLILCSLISACPLAASEGAARGELSNSAHTLAPPMRTGTNALKETLVSGYARPLSMAAADFDGDGITDVICGYTNDEGGGLAELRRGNADSFFPNSLDAVKHGAENSFNDTSFTAESLVFALPVAPDYLVAGDFNGDGYQDLACAADGRSAFFVLLGNGTGEFEKPRRIRLPGALTILAAGDINRRDGIPELIIGVTGSDGARLLVFESPSGALGATPETIGLPGEAIEVVFGRFSEGYVRDMAVLLASGDIVHIPGRDRALSFDEKTQDGVPAASVVSLPVAGSVALAAGNFLGSERDVLASLSPDGNVSFITPRLPHEAFTIAGSLEGPVSSTPQSTGNGVIKKRPRLTTLPSVGRDRLVINRNGRTLRSMVANQGGQNAVVRAHTLDTPAAAVLPMLLDEDAFPDLLVLGGDAGAPLSVVPTNADRVFVVNSGDYANDAGFDKRKYDGVCATKEGVCTLNAAMYECAGPSGNGTCTIRFNIPGGGVPAAAFLENEVLTSAPGAVYDGTTQPGGFVRIHNHLNQVTFKAGSVLKGLVLEYATVGDNSRVEGCRIGTNDEGADIGTWGGGLTIGSNCTVGGKTVAARNIFSSFHEVSDSLTIKGNGNRVTGNWFGINAAGTGSLDMGTAIRIVTPEGKTIGAANNVIGGTTAKARNIIWGQGGVIQTMVQMDPGTSGNLFQGNYLGTEPSGTMAVSTSKSVAGIRLGGKGNTVGGTTASARNVIVGATGSNDGSGIEVIGAPSLTSGLVIQGNFIGLDKNGANALGHWFHGVLISPESESIAVGGTAQGAGNVISNSKYYGVFVQGKNQDGTQGASRANKIQGNYIGTDVTGTVSIPNAIGVDILNSPDNLVGGTQAGARNVISGNGVYGVYIGGATSVGNKVLGNYVGVDATGLRKLPQPWFGLMIEAPNNIIGGLKAAARNVISCNGQTNIRLNGSVATGNKIQGNYIGPGSDGVTNPGGGYWGIIAIGGASGNTIGGLEAGAGNVIAFNKYQGVVVMSDTAPHSVENAILGNSIRSNEKMGIDLGYDGVTPNDYLDADIGPNQLQNAPVITAIETATGYVVNGSLHSLPSTAFTLQFFSNCTLNAENMAGGETLMGTRTVTTSSFGDALFSYTFPTPKCPMITATATDPCGNTSEFSLWVTPASPIFKDNFKSKAVGWSVKSGKWSVVSKRYQSGANTKNLSTVAQFDPAASPVGAARIQSSIMLDASGGGANGGLVFAFNDNNNYRWVQLKPGSVSLGQTGTINGEQPRTLASVATKKVKAGKACIVRLDVYPEGKVEVYIDGTMVLSGTFHNGVATGGVGLMAKKTATIFDDFTVWDASTLPNTRRE